MRFGIAIVLYSRPMRTTTTTALLAVTLLSVLGLPGCGGNQPKTISGNTPILPQRRLLCRIREGVLGDGTEDVKLDASTSVDAKVGETVRIELEAAGGTGFEWRAIGWTEGSNTSSTVGATPMVATANFDWSTGAGTVVPAKNDVVGGPTNWAFEVKAVQPGALTITFALARSWEKDQKPADQRTLTINVN